MLVMNATTGKKRFMAREMVIPRLEGGLGLLGATIADESVESDTDIIGGCWGRNPTDGGNRGGNLGKEKMDSPPRARHLRAQFKMNISIPPLWQW